jgi:nucleoid-associated protein YgaU
VRLPPARGRRADAATSRRRRLLVITVVSFALLVAVARIDGGATSAAPDAPAPPAVPGRLDVPAGGVYVVQPGDTLWSIARRLQPDGDIRATVDRLAEIHGSAAVAVGDRIALDRPVRGP